MKKDIQLNICYICFRDRLETNLEQLSRCMANRGHKITIINFSDSKKASNYTADGRRIIYINLHGKLQFNSRINIRIKRLLFLHRTIQILKHHDFSIIHIDFDCPYFWVLKLFFLRSKFIYHIQTFPISTKKIRFDVYRSLVYVFLQSFFMDAIIIQSTEQKKKWIGTGKLKKTRIVPIGINGQILFPISDNVKLELRKKFGISTDQSILIYAGTISKTRNLEILIKAVYNLANNDKNYKIKLLMVGYGDAVEDMKKITKSMKLTEHIIFAGNIPYEDMVKYYGIADVGISYIPINENYNYNPPLKTYEYLACGLPCIATKTISNSQIIKDKINGILIDDTDQSLTNAIDNLLNNSSLLLELKRNARSSVINQDFNQIADNLLLPLYYDILKK